MIVWKNFTHCVGNTISLSSQRVRLVMLCIFFSSCLKKIYEETKTTNECFLQRELPPYSNLYTFCLCVSELHCHTGHTHTAIHFYTIPHIPCCSHNYPEEHQIVKSQTKTLFKCNIFPKLQCPAV